MKVKEKNCKGIGKAYGIKGCGILTMYRRYGLCQSCLADFLLNNDKGKVILEKATLKATKNSRELKAQKLDRDARVKLSALIEQTQVLFNKYIRLRDEGKPCISSGHPYKRDNEAGHCFSVKQYAGLRFDYDNVHGQSVQDNRFNEGNHLDYLINLPKRIGEERFHALIKRAEDYKKNGHKFTRDELYDIQKEVKQKIKNL